MQLTPCSDSRALTLSPGFRQIAGARALPRRSLTPPAAARRPLPSRKTHLPARGTDTDTRSRICGWGLGVVEGAMDRGSYWGYRMNDYATMLDEPDGALQSFDLRSRSVSCCPGREPHTDAQGVFALIPQKPYAFRFGLPSPLGRP